MSKNIFAQSAGLQLSNSSQSQIASKSQRSEAITFELNGDGARLDLAAVVQAAPFEALASVTEAQPAPSDADRILPSAAAFHDASIDALHHGLVPLALLGQEGKSGNLFAGVSQPLSPHHNVVATPTITVPPPGGQSTTVFEAGLGPRTGEPPGTHPGQSAFPTTTKTGTISFSSDGLSKIELGDPNGPRGGIVLDSGHPSGSFTDATGTLTASYTFNALTGKGTITYTYTLLDNTLGNPLVNNGNTSASFAVVVTDSGGDTNPPANLVIKITDDAPVARADTDALTPGQMTADGNVLTGAGTTSGVADLQGADGSVTVVGVAKGNGPGGAAPGTVGVEIIGLLGKLTLNADGSYTYIATGGGGSDVFTYTTRDADGSLAHATLTINLGDAAPSNIVIPAPGGQVFEAGLPARGTEPAGSDPTKPTTTQTGTITFTSPDGVSKIELGGLVLTAPGVQQSFTDATGTLTASFTYDSVTRLGTITYRYTLLDNTIGTPSVSFPVAVTDADGDRTAGGNLVINIVDDAPVAVADTDSTAAGQTTAETGNVLDGSGTTSSGADVRGADGATVTSVALGNGTPVNVDPTAGATIVGNFGTLTIHADGSYSYAHNGKPGGGTDAFTYTIKDGDNDLSSATLTIAVADSTPGGIQIPAAGGADTQVFEAGLPARGTEPAGSDPTKPITTQTGTITFTSPDGVSKIELGGLLLTVAGVQGSFTDATGTLTASFTYNPLTGQGTITYRYTLLDNTIGTPSASFPVAVTDADGDRTAGGNLVINIVDDAPVAVADTDSTAAGQTTAETGNVLDGSGTTSSGADVRGADGATVTSIAFGGTVITVDPTAGATIVGNFGTLTIHADGSYSYAHNGAPGGGTDAFTYTITDGDGDLSSATLTIAVADSTPGGIQIPGAGGADTQVFEAGLPARGTEPAGSEPTKPTTTQTGTITFTSPDGVSKIELGGLVLTVAGVQGSFTDATGTLTASFTYNPLTGLGTITFTYTLLDNTIGIPSVSFPVAVTDADGDRTAGGNLAINIVDDAAVANADTDARPRQARMCGVPTARR
jgi:VCBS repeat-containing protein